MIMNTTTLILLILAAILSTGLLVRDIVVRSQRLRRRLQMGQVFTEIAHELLTPLTVISASVDHLREAVPEQEHDYDMMQLNIQRMVRLLQQILETSKSQAGELKLLVANGDVMQYIHDTANCLRPLMSRKGLTFTIECTPRSMMGWIDTDKLDKIIYNLLSNAAKYTEQGSVSLDVHTSKNYDRIYIKVRDTGSGIPKEKMKHLYERYYDGDYRQHRTIGTGLGLALTHDLVYLHRGTIACKSEAGQGTTFTVTLPITKEAYKPEQIDDSHTIDFNIPKNAIIDFQSIVPDVNRDNSEDSQNENAYKILIVEDNLELLILMQHVLKSYYRVYVAQNGAKALEIIYKTPIDLIIADVMMPEMDGLELTRILKGDPDYQHLPIVLLTAKTQKEDEEEAYRIGADEYLRKPFRLKDLKLRIDNIISNRKRALPESPVQPEEEPPLQEETPEQEFVRKATACVMAHLGDADFDRDTFAAEMGASSSTLYKKLRAATGMNVSVFIRDTRMREAYRTAQSNPTMRVSDLAYKMGFQDPKYFSTCFKNQFGVQPKEFMDSLLRGDTPTATAPET